MFRIKLLIAVLVTASLHAEAQLFAGINGLLSYPFDLKRQGFYNAVSLGVGINAGYFLSSGRIYPSASFQLSYVNPPIYSNLFNDINTQSVYKNVALSLNYLLHNNDKRKVTFYGGINAVGISINSSHVLVNANSSDMQLIGDGRNYIYPGVHIGFRYMGSLNIPNLYWIADANIGYIRVFESNNYRLVSKNYYEDVTIEGNVCNPVFMIGVKYVFGKPAKPRF